MEEAVIGPAERRAFDEDGFVNVRGFVSPPQVVELRTALERAAEADPGENELSVDGMRFASNLYRSAPVLRGFLCSPAVVEVLTSLAGPDLWLRWDQAVWKDHGAPEFPWHQDNGYTRLEVEHLQLWVALTAMDERNGGLLLCPGHHRKMLEHHPVGGHMHADPPGPTRSIEADAGDVIVFSSYLPHATSPHTCGGTRLAYVAEFLPLTSPDASVSPPHLVVARDGRPCSEWSDLNALWADRRPQGRS